MYMQPENGSNLHKTIHRIYCVTGLKATLHRQCTNKTVPEFVLQQKHGNGNANSKWDKLPHSNMWMDQQKHSKESNETTNTAVFPNDEADPIVRAIFISHVFDLVELW